MNCKVIGLTEPGFENARSGCEPTTIRFPDLPEWEANALTHSVVLMCGLCLCIYTQPSLTDLYSRDSSRYNYLHTPSAWEPNYYLSVPEASAGLLFRHRPHESTTYTVPGRYRSPDIAGILGFLVFSSTFVCGWDFISRCLREMYTGYKVQNIGLPRSGV